MLSAAKVVLTCGAIDERVWSCKLSQCSHRTMSKRPILRGAWLGLDLIIPIGALLVICFSVGSIFFDGTNHFSSGPPSHVLEAYQRTGSIAPSSVKAPS